MSKFVDDKGREFEIRLTAGAIIRICRKMGLTVGDLTANSKLEVATMMEAAVELIAPQLSKLGVSRDEYIEDLGMNDIKKMYESLVEEIGVAFPQVATKMGSGGEGDSGNEDGLGN